MTQSGTSIEDSNNNIQFLTSLIKEIFVAEFGSDSDLLNDILIDIAELYQGKWDSHQSCQTGYHDLGHALDVTLLTARMIGGWNSLNDHDHPKIGPDLFLAAIASALFHDSGYIKAKDDPKGTGGKYSFNHEARSMALARSYLARKNWPARTIDLVPAIISLTRFNVPLQFEGLFESKEEDVIGRMMATADLVAQMADVNYMDRIKDLYNELKEAYDFESIAALEKSGYKVFSSAQEMIDGTMDFYENFVIPRLEELNHMDHYLMEFFSEGRNPYLENITANLSGQLATKRHSWQRLGDVLSELGMASQDQIQAALKLQSQSRKIRTKVDKAPKSLPLSETLIAWMEGTLSAGKCIGEYLMDMDILSPKHLRTGLLHQVLPANMIESLSRKELVFLLQISLLRQNISRGPWLLNQILEMTNERLACEGSHILLAKAESQEMLIAVPTGPNRDQLDGQIFPADKGLAGWVFSHGHPAIVTNVSKDKRFDSEIDRKARGKYDTESILAVPLNINGELIGVMEAINKVEGEFTEHDLNILTLIANVITTSLEGVFHLQGPCS
ncbi:MAG: GAF domain-containing protein [Thermodesulfobacteriota bacterium]